MQDAAGSTGDASKAGLRFSRLGEDELAALRYRVTGVLRTLTPAAVRAARAADLKAEVLNSAKLQVGSLLLLFSC